MPPRVGFEPTIPVFDRAKTVHALYREATVIGKICIHSTNFQKHLIDVCCITKTKHLLTKRTTLWYPSNCGLQGRPLSSSRPSTDVEPYFRETVNIQLKTKWRKYAHRMYRPIVIKRCMTGIRLQRRILHVLVLRNVYQSGRPTHLNIIWVTDAHKHGVSMLSTLRFIWWDIRN
jgi:hypothetical protein